MRTPVFHSFDSWRLSGVNTWSINLEKTMRGDSQFENVLLFTGEPYKWHGHLLSRDVPYAHLELPAVRTREQEWTALKDFLESNAPCIYIPNYDFHRSSAIATLSAEVKVLLIVHSDEQCYYESVARLAPSSNAVVAVSSMLERELIGRFPDIASRISKVPYGVASTGAIGRQAARKEQLSIAYCNRLSQYQKRIFDLPVLCRELQQLGLDFRLTVAGAGPDEKELQSRFVEAGVQNNVQMLGLMSAAEVRKTLEQSDVFLLVSDFEGLPISLLEAMAEGCVPVVYDIESGVRDAIKNGVNGILVPHGNTVVMARELAALHASRHRLDSLSQAAMRTQVEKFSLERMAADYRSLFSKILAQDGKALRRDGVVRKSPDLTFRYRMLRRAGFLR